MSIRGNRNFKFLNSELEVWQAEADKETGGNLTAWIRLACAERLNSRNRLAELEGKIDKLTKAVQQG